MMYARAIRAPLLIGSLLCLAVGPALTQPQPERVPLIMTKLPPANSALYKRIIKHAGKARGQVLTLTKSEMWEVPKENVDAVKKAAAEHGANATPLGSDWNQVFHSMPSDMKMNDKQKTMMDQAKESKSTMGVGMMATPMAPMVEYALTKDAGPNIGGPATSKEAARITIKLSDKTELTIVRTNVDIKSDMCIWRGAVEGTDAPATIMWWPGGKMAGTVQHQGKIYSIRHMGGEMHAVVEMGEDRMPQEHAPMPERMRANDPNLRDDPLRNEGDGSIMRPKRQQKGGELKGRKQAKLQQTKATADQKVAAVSAATHQPRRRPQRPSPAQGHRHRRASSPTPRRRRATTSTSSASWSTWPSRRATSSSARAASATSSCRLVHAYQTDYVEEGAHFDHVWRFADKGDGYMEEIHRLRDKFKADVAHTHRGRSEGLRARDTRLRRPRRGLRRGAPRVRGRELHVGARDRPPDRRPPRPEPRQEHQPVPLRPRLRQRHQVARHHELQGELRRLSAHAGLVEPERARSRASRPERRTSTTPA